MNSTEETVEVPVKPKKLTAAAYKVKYGYSRTQKRNMRKAGVEPSVENLKVLREKAKSMRKAEGKIQRKKYEESQAWMRSKGKARKSKHKHRTKGWQSGSKGKVVTVAPVATAIDNSKK